MRKMSLPAAALLLVLLAACSPSAPPPEGSSGSAASSETVTDDGGGASSAAAMVPDTSDDDQDTPPIPTLEPPAPAPSKPSARVIDMTVTNFAFAPAQVTVKKDQKVTLRVTGAEGTHGLAIPELGINVSIAPGETVTVEVPTGKAGTFSFFCSIPCGSGHRDMKGTVVVE